MLEGGSESEAVMDDIAQYSKYADECRGLAAAAKTSEHKTQLLEMAAAWETVARQTKGELGQQAR
jgi:hypothetical protein